MFKYFKYLLLFVELIAIFLLLRFNFYPDKFATKQNFPTEISPPQFEPSNYFGDLLKSLKIAKDNPTEKLISKILAPTFKKTYSIAIYGDSMVETMGENLEYLDKSMKKYYPRFDFKFYNYGIGGDNIDKGLSRLNEEFHRNTRNYPALSQLHPDVLIIGSFSYNPFVPHDKDKHARLLAELANRGRLVSNKTYILKEIAPLETGFGKGPRGVNWPEDSVKVHVGYILDQLANVSDVTNYLNVGLIDVYSVSIIPGSRFGKPLYVNKDDGIHPSVEGIILTADKIASTISLP